MNKLKEIHDKEIKKLKLKSFVINGKNRNNIINYDDMKNNKNLIVDIIVEKNKLYNKINFQIEEDENYE